MKRNRYMRAACALLVLTLATSCFVGGTFAKYTVAATASDTARVAKFGVDIDSTAAGGALGLFEQEYAATDVSATSAGILNSVSATTEVLAPGTKSEGGAAGEFTLFEITGTPEVAVKVSVNMDNVKMVTIPKTNGGGPTSYPDMTVVPNGTFTMDSEDYHPVQWTLKKDGTAVVTKGTLQDVADAVNALTTGSTGKYVAAGTDLETALGLEGKYTLSWEWPFGDALLTNQQDTLLGNVSAGTHTDATILTTEGFDLSVKVEQVD